MLSPKFLMTLAAMHLKLTSPCSTQLRVIFANIKLNEKSTYIIIIFLLVGAAWSTRKGWGSGSTTNEPVWCCMLQKTSLFLMLTKSSARPALRGWGWWVWEVSRVACKPSVLEALEGSVFMQQNDRWMSISVGVRAPQKDTKNIGTACSP